MTSTTKKKAAVEPMVNYWGVNIISSIEPKDSIPRKAIYVHSIHHEASKVSKDKIDDPFIYNPFAQKKEEKVLYRADDRNVSPSNLTCIRMLCW